MSGFGILPFGTVAPWGGPGLLSLITILCVGENHLIAFFTAPPKARDPLGFQDAANALNWRVDPIDPVTITIEGKVLVEPGKRRPTRTIIVNECVADEDDPTQLHIFTAPTLEPGIEYAVSLVGVIKGKACEAFGGLATLTVRARNKPRPQRSGLAAVDTYADWSNPFFETDPVTGQLVARDRTWRLNEAGEMVIADNAESLKTRILQRIWTERGGFALIPDYGVTSFAKKVARPYAVQQLAIRTQEQILREPDVREAAVEASVEVGASGGGVVRLVITVTPRSTGVVSFVVQSPLK